MAKPPSRELQAFMAKHEIDSDEIWEVRAGAYAIKHAAIERIAAKAGVKFDRPAFLEHDAAAGIVSMVVFGKLGDREEWSTGEANPKNNKNQYPYAIAEKRAKDRVALKLLTAVDNVTGAALYSEEESDDFKRPNPHVTRPEDIFEPVEHDQNGQPVDNIPLPDPSIKPLPKKNARAIFDDLQKEIWACGAIAQLASWAERNKDRVGALPTDWQQILRGVYAEHRDAIRNQDAQDNERLAS